MKDSVLVTERDGPVLTMRINRPESENRLNLAVLRELCSALEKADADEKVRVLVLTGTGDTFCCGGDLEELTTGDREAYGDFAEHFARLHLNIARLSKPVLAAVNGDARAGGVSLLSICDLAVARESARFSMPEIKSGLWPVMAMVTLQRALPRKRAFELYYFGEPFDAQEAKKLGLLNWVVPAGELDREVRQRAALLSSLPRSAVRIGRPTFAGIEERFYEQGFKYGAGRLIELLTDPEVVKGLAVRKEPKLR